MEGGKGKRKKQSRVGKIDGFFAQGESWCDPRNGSSRVVVGMGRRAGASVERKGEAKKAVQFLSDPELARQKMQVAAPQ